MPLAVSHPASSAGRIAALLILILALAATPKSSASGVEVVLRVPFDEGAVPRVGPRVPFEKGAVPRVGPRVPFEKGAVLRVAPRERFDETVAAVFRERCVRCHGPDEASGGLRLDDYDAVMRGGERGPVVMPGNARSSLLMRKILRHDKPAMPPRKPLPPSEIRSIRAWIESGAGP